MGASGPGATNLLTGVATAFTDCAPLVAIGGSSPRVSLGMEAFQEIDQLAVFKPVTKWAERCYDAKRIPDVVASAFRQATSGRPGPVYIDMPGDVLGEKIEEEQRHVRAGVEAVAADARRHRRHQGGHRAAGAKAERPLVDRRQRRLVVGRRRRVAGVRRGHRHSVLHQADLARPHPRGPRAVVPERAQHGVHRGRRRRWPSARASTG